MSDSQSKQRVAFLLRIREGVGETYDRIHEQVWPEMLELLKRSGILEYSIFRRDEMLVLVMTLDAEDSFDAVWERIEADPVNTRWQESMAPYFAPLPDLRPGERFPLLREVFHLL